MAFAPALLAIAGTAYTGYQKYSADQYNAKVMQTEQKVSVDQANAQEGLVRRQSREALGREAAAFGGAGVGYGGSSETALDQSAINQELDALTTRYKGAITGYGYGVQSSILNRQANQDVESSVLMAGGQALQAALAKRDYTNSAAGAG